MKSDKVYPSEWFFKRFKIEGVIIIKLRDCQRNQCGRKNDHQPEIAKGSVNEWNMLFGIGMFRMMLFHSCGQWFIHAFDHSSSLYFLDFGL